MTTPPILEEIRRVRHQISAEIGHDPKRIREYYAALQEAVKSRTVNFADQGVAGRTKHCIEATDQPLPNASATPATR